MIYGMRGEAKNGGSSSELPVGGDRGKNSYLDSPVYNTVA